MLKCHLKWNLFFSLSLSRRAILDLHWNHEWDLLQLELSLNVIINFVQLWETEICFFSPPSTTISSHLKKELQSLTTVVTEQQYDAALHDLAIIIT